MFIRQQMVYKSVSHFVNRWPDIQRRRRTSFNALDDYEEGSWTPTLAKLEHQEQSHLLIMHLDPTEANWKRELTLDFVLLVQSIWYIWYNDWTVVRNGITI